MQQFDKPLSGDDEEKSEVKPTIEVIRQSVRINGKEKPSLFEHQREVWPESEEGALASWFSAAAVDDPLPRDEIFKLIELHEIDTAAMIEYEQYVFADDSTGSLLWIVSAM